jgi:hypothetical protein
VLHEVEQRRVGPLHVLEREHGGVDVCEALEEEPPGREEVLPLEPALAPDPEQVGHPRLDERALLRIADVIVQDIGQLRHHRLVRLVLADAAAHAHHVGQRAVGHSLAVGRAPAAVPVDHLGQAVEVLVELPDEPRLADARDPGHRDEMGPALVGAGVEEILDLAQLAVAADERRLEPLRLERAARARDDPHGPPQPVQADLALELVLAGVLVDDGRLGRAPRCVADEHLPGLRQRLHPGGRVDDVARHHALAHGADGHGRLTREHPRPHPQVGDADLVPERGHGRDQVERRPDGPLGIVLGGVVGAPDGHDGVADELLDDAAVELDQPPADVEVARQQGADVLGVARLRERREPDNVGEEHGDQAPLRRRLAGDDGRGALRRAIPRDDRGPALAAEPVVRQDGCPTRAADRGQRRAAPAAESLAGRVFRPARGADHAPSVRDRPGRRLVRGAAQLFSNSRR